MEKLPSILLLVVLVLSGWCICPLRGQSDIVDVEEDFTNNTAIQYLNVGVLMASNLGGLWI